MKISGVLPVTGLENQGEGAVEIDANHEWRYFGDTNKMTRCTISIYNPNLSVMTGIRLGDLVRVTVEVLDGTNGTGEG